MPDVTARPVARTGCTVALLAALLAAALAMAAAADDGAGQPGGQTVEQVCSNCHGAGLMGAPRIGDTPAWQARLHSAGSVDKLAESAARGKGNMPPRGGQPGLTEDDLKAAIRYMLSQSGA